MLRSHRSLLRRMAKYHSSVGCSCRIDVVLKWCCCAFPKCSLEATISMMLGCSDVSDAWKRRRRGVWTFTIPLDVTVRRPWHDKRLLSRLGRCNQCSSCMYLFFLMISMWTIDSIRCHRYCWCSDAFYWCTLIVHSYCGCSMHTWMSSMSTL